MTTTDIKTQKPDSLSRLGGFLAAGFTFITAAFAAFGIAAGDFERIFRNRASEALIGLVFIAFGVASGIIVSNTQKGSSYLVGTPLAALTVGLGLVVGVALSSILNPEVGLTATQPWQWVLFVAAVLVLGISLFYAYYRVPKFDVKSERSASSSGVPPLSSRAKGRYLVTMGFISSAALGTIAWTGVGWSASLLILSGWFAIGALLRVFWPPRIQPRALLLVFGFISFFVGLGVVFNLAVENTSAKDRPTITAEIVEIDNTFTLNVNVVAVGLRNDEHILVTVEGLNREEVLSDVRAGRTTDDPRPGVDSLQTMYLSRTGPDENGKVELEIKVPLSPGLYERLKISAFLASPGGDDPVGQLESLQREIRLETERRDAFNQANGVFELDDDQEISNRAAYDEEHDGVIDEEEQTRREEIDRTNFNAKVGEDELLKRANFDAATKTKADNLNKKLQQDLLLDVRCGAGLQARGCVILLMPETPNRPLLEVDAAATADGTVLRVSVDIEAMSADDLILLQVFTKTHVEGEYSNPIYAASLPPSEIGALHADLNILIVAADAAWACVVADLVEAGYRQDGLSFEPQGSCIQSKPEASAVELMLPR